jgi:hypothetical protein
MIFSSLSRDFFIRVLRRENSTPKWSSESGGYNIEDDMNGWSFGFGGDLGLGESVGGQITAGSGDAGFNKGLPKTRLLGKGGVGWD